MTLKWKSGHSTTLSLVLTYVAAAFLLLSMFFAYDLIRAMLSGNIFITYFELKHPFAPAALNETGRSLLHLLLVVFYACCPAGWVAVAVLLKLLHNIRAKKIFIRQNIKLLRILSWCFIFVTLVSLVALFWYQPLLIIFIAAGFLSVILRVVKNVFAEAIILREEQDLTI